MRLVFAEPHSHTKKTRYAFEFFATLRVTSRIIERGSTALLSQFLEKVTALARAGADQADQ